MAAQTQTATAPKAELTGEEKIQQLRELFADASEVGKRALENVIKSCRRRFPNRRRQSKAPGALVPVSASARS